MERNPDRSWLNFLHKCTQYFHSAISVQWSKFWNELEKYCYDGCLQEGKSQFILGVTATLYDLQVHLHVRLAKMH